MKFEAGSWRRCTANETARSATRTQPAAPNPEVLIKVIRLLAIAKHSAVLEFCNLRERKFLVEFENQGVCELTRMLSDNPQRNNGEGGGNVVMDQKLWRYTI